MGPVEPLAGLGWAAAGAALGAGAGLVPGLHPNTLATAVLLVGLGGSLPGTGASLLLAGLLGAWTFANAVPLIVLGVPDGADAPALLPGQRMAREGNAEAALVASARGSLQGLVAGAAAALALAWAFGALEPRSLIQAATPWVQAIALTVLVATDPAGLARASLAAATAGALGLAALEAPVASPFAFPATPLAPLFIGLFGLPALRNAMRAGAPPAPIPRLVEDEVETPGPGPAMLGSGLGLLAGTFAGFTSGPATAIAVLVRRGRDAAVLATTAAVNTSAVCVATAMLHAAGRTRTGVHAAQKALAPPPPGLPGLPRALAALAVGGVLGLALLASAAHHWQRLAAWIPRAAPWLLVAWAILVGVQTGPLGFLVAAAAWSVARAAAALGARRSILMASLLVPGLVDTLL